MRSGEGGRSDPLGAVNDGAGRSRVGRDVFTGRGRPRCFKRNNEDQLAGGGHGWLPFTGHHHQRPRVVLTMADSNPAQGE